MSRPKEFPAAPLDRFARGATTLTIAVIVGTAALLLAIAPIGQVLWTMPIFAAIIGLTWSMSPTGYVLQNDQLRVQRRRWRPFVATVESLADMENPQKVGLRFAGSGGAWGFWGRFWRRDLGVYRAYLTSLDATHIVALQTDVGLVTVSPEDADSFRRTVRYTQ